MNKLFYVPATKINARIADTVVEGYPIKIDGYQYEKVSRAPRGRRILRKLLNVESQEQIVIYS